jgi:hypothetical protein
MTLQVRRQRRQFVETIKAEVPARLDLREREREPARSRCPGDRQAALQRDRKEGLAPYRQ